MRVVGGRRAVGGALVVDRLRVSCGVGLGL